MLVLILVVIVNSFIEKSLLESSMTLSPITKYWNYIHESKESFLIMLLISRSCYSSDWLPKPLLHRQYVFRLSSYSPRPVLARTIVPYGGKTQKHWMDAQRRSLASTVPILPIISSILLSFYPCSVYLSTSRSTSIWKMQNAEGQNVDLYIPVCKENIIFYFM